MVGGLDWNMSLSVTPGNLDTQRHTFAFYGRHPHWNIGIFTHGNSKGISTKKYILHFCINFLLHLRGREGGSALPWSTADWRALRYIWVGPAVWHYTFPVWLCLSEWVGCSIIPLWLEIREWVGQGWARACTRTWPDLFTHTPHSSSHNLSLNMTLKCTFHFVLFSLNLDVLFSSLLDVLTDLTFYQFVTPMHYAAIPM